MFSRVLPPLLVGLALLFALASCGKKQNGSSSASAARSYRVDVPLSEVEAESGCLSLPKLFAGLRALDPQRPSVTVPVAITFESLASVRDSFRRLVALGQLSVARQPIGPALALPELWQEGCSKVTVNGVDGTEKEFTIRDHAADSLMAEADDGERLEFAWLSPQRVRSRHRYAAFDQPCDASGKPVLVTVGKVIDWSDAGVPAQVPAEGSPLSIDAEFISLASAAVGESADSVYETGADGAKEIVLGRLGQLTMHAPLPEVVACANVAPPNPNVPAIPDPNTPTPGDDPHGDDTPGPNR